MYLMHRKRPSMKKISSFRPSFGLGQDGRSHFMENYLLFLMFRQLSQPKSQLSQPKSHGRPKVTDSQER